MYQVRISIEVVNMHGEAVNPRGYPAAGSNQKAVRCENSMGKEYTTVSEAQDALNRFHRVIGSVAELERA